MAKPTYEDALASLGIDYPDETIKRNVTRKLGAAISTLYGAVGEDVFDLMPNDERPAELVMTYLDDLYYNRGTSAKVSGAVRESVKTMELQLRLELRDLREQTDISGDTVPIITDATGQEMVAALLEIKDAIENQNGGTDAEEAAAV